jgi:hypothetical protein
MASRKEPAFLTCSHVKVVRLAAARLLRATLYVAEMDPTAERSYGGIDWLDKDTFAMQLRSI